MHRIALVIYVFVLVACESKSYSPQAQFTFTVANGDYNVARQLLHDVAINNNLFFNDSSHTYPSSSKVILAVAERADGLKVILTDADENMASISIHCHDKCKDWQDIYTLTKESFSKKWSLK